MTTTTAPTTELPPLVGTTEIAEMLGVERRTVNQWRHRAKVARDAGNDSPSLLPPEAQVVSERPVWLRSTIEAWAEARRASGEPLDT